MKQKKEIIENAVNLLEKMDCHYLEHTYNIIKIMAEANTDTCKDSANNYEISEISK